MQRSTVGIILMAAAVVIGLALGLWQSKTRSQRAAVLSAFLSLGVLIALFCYVIIVQQHRELATLFVVGCVVVPAVLYFVVGRIVPDKEQVLAPDDVNMATEKHPAAPASLGTDSDSEKSERPASKDDKGAKSSVRKRMRKPKPNAAKRSDGDVSVGTSVEPAASVAGEDAVVVDGNAGHDGVKRAAAKRAAAQRAAAEQTAGKVAAERAAEEAAKRRAAQRAAELEAAEQRAAAQRAAEREAAEREAAQRAAAEREAAQRAAERADKEQATVAQGADETPVAHGMPIVAEGVSQAQITQAKPVTLKPLPESRLDTFGWNRRHMDGGEEPLSEAEMAKAAEERAVAKRREAEREAAERAAAQHAAAEKAAAERAAAQHAAAERREVERAGATMQQGEAMRGDVEASVVADEVEARRQAAMRQAEQARIAAERKVAAERAAAERRAAEQAAAQRAAAEQQAAQRAAAEQQAAQRAAAAAASFNPERYFTRATLLRDRGLFSAAAKLYAECAGLTQDDATYRRASIEQIACYVKGGMPEQARELAERLKASSSDLTMGERIKIEAVLKLAEQ